jgi:hypothetical protein
LLSPSNLVAFATATTWTFNCLLALTFPSMLALMGATGAFSYYAVWCLVGFVLVFLFVPETKARSLEELDLVFETPTKVHATWRVKRLVVGEKRAGEEPLGEDVR